MLLARRCPNAATVGRRPAALRRLTRRASSKPSQETGRPRHASRSGAGAEIPFLNAFPQGQQRQPQQPCPQQQQQQQQHPRQQRHRDERQLPPTQPGSPTSPPEAATTTSKSADISTRIGSSSSSSTGSNNKLGLALLMSAVREVSLARRDLGWGVDAVAMRLTMLGFLRHARSKPGAAAIPEEAIMVDGGRDWLDDRASEWERFLMWSHASYGWTEEVVLQRAGVERDELEVVALSRGKSRNRPMAPTYVLAVDHARREIVLSVRGTKAFGDAITITHFRPEPFLGGYAHRGFAKSAHYLVKEVEPQLISLTDRLPDYRVCFTGHSMGGGIAAMASMLIRDSATRRRRRFQKNQQQHSATTSGPNPPESTRTSSATEPSTSTKATATSAASTTPGAAGEAQPHLGRRKLEVDGGGPEGGSGDEERAARGTRDEMPEGLRQDLGVRLGLESAPMVYSFATPCCVSLDLARGCEDWVESIVHGDDAIPRLSTVSLELLKEDMTAAEWRRAIDRLAHLNTVLAPSTKAAAAVAAALKNALAGLGSLSRTQRTPGTAAPAEDVVVVGGGEDSGRRPAKAPAGGLGDTDGSGVDGLRGSGAGGGGGAGSGEFESSREGWREKGGALPRREEEVVGAARAVTMTALAAAEAEAEAEAEAAKKAVEKRASSLAAESETAGAAGAAAGIGGDGVETRAGARRVGGGGGGGDGDGDTEHGSERGRKDGNGGDEKENSKKRDDLGRSIRDTALTMRGLAKLYPLSQSFRQEIASMVAQVVNLTGGETGDGAGAIKPARSQALNTAGRTDSEISSSSSSSGSSGSSSSAGSGRRISGGKESHSRSSSGSADDAGGGKGWGSHGVAVEGEGGGVEVVPSSRPELLLTLKGNLEVLGASRAALHGDDPNGAGAGGKPEAADGTNSDVTRRCPAAPDTSAGVADAGPRAATAGGAATGPGAPSASLHDRPIGDGGAVGAAARATVDAASSVASESMRQSSESASSTKATQVRGTAALSEEGARVGSDDDDRLRCLHESYLARPEPSLLPLYPPGDPFLLCNGSSNNSTAAAAAAAVMKGGGNDGDGGGGGTGGSSSGGGLGFAVSESMAASSAAAKGAGAGSGEDGVVLVRVPHEHFLRMPLSPSMLEDHSMSSYQRALAGLSKKNPTGPGV